MKISIYIANILYIIYIDRRRSYILSMKMLSALYRIMRNLVIIANKGELRKISIRLQSQMKYLRYAQNVRSKPLKQGSSEVTTFRIDRKYSDGRRPDSVQFTSKIEEDLSRRDFTINAMAYNVRSGLIDSFGGKGRY